LTARHVAGPPVREYSREDCRNEAFAVGKIAPKTYNPDHPTSQQADSNPQALRNTDSPVNIKNGVDSQFTTRTIEAGVGRQAEEFSFMMRRTRFTP
jgi:hypothetical protein